MADRFTLFPGRLLDQFAQDESATLEQKQPLPIGMRLVISAGNRIAWQLAGESFGDDSFPVA
jgi:hypothetical protein